MQKLVNVLAVASAAVSVAVVGSGLYVYLNRASIIDGIKSQALEAVLGGVGSLGGLAGESSSPLGGDLPTGANDLSPVTNPAAAPQASSPF